MMNNNVNCTKMQVWSAGENGKTKKKEMIIGYIVSVLWVALIVTFFVCSEQKTIGARIAETICMGVFTSLIGFVGPAMVKLSLDAIRRNRLIELWLYDINDFSKLGGVPENMFTAFADSSGVVLCDTKYERHYRDWIGYGNENLSYHDFVDYYKKHFGKDTIIQEQNAPTTTT